MRIDLLTSNDTQSRSVPNALSLWRVGVVLDATAVRDPTSGQLWLQLDNRRLPARIASGDSDGPAHGEQLKLRVLRDSPVLALETVESAAGADVTGAALRRNLPQQTVPTPLLANLAWLARNPAAASALPQAVADAADRLWQSLPTAAALSNAEELANVLSKSGVFLESAIAKSHSLMDAASLLSQDFKARLLELKQALSAAGANSNSPAENSAAPGPLPVLRGPLAAIGAAPASFAVIDGRDAQLQELARQTQGSLARVNSTQLINAEAAQSGALACLIEAPFRQDERAEVLRFRFEREHGGGEHAAWSVEAVLDLGVNGSLHARVSLQGKRLAVQLRSESPMLIELLNQRAPALTAALQATGFVIDRVMCLHGAPIRDPGEHALRLLDLHA